MNVVKGFESLRKGGISGHRLSHVKSDEGALLDVKIRHTEVRLVPLL